MVRDFGREADELRQAFESAVEHSDLLAIRRVLRDFIELAADNLEQQPETLTAMNTLANVLDDPGTIEMIKRVGVEESPFVMAEQELLERLRELPVNLIMVAPRKLQAVIFVAQRRFDKAVALGEEAAFAVALALRAQMGVRPRRIEQIMAALAGAKQEVVVNALELVNADARAGDFERWDQNLAHWFGSLREPHQLSVLAKKMAAGPRRLYEPVQRAYRRLMELRNVLGGMTLISEPELSLLRKAAGGEMSEEEIEALCSRFAAVDVQSLKGKRGLFVSRTFVEVLMDVFNVVCGPHGGRYTTTLPASNHFVATTSSGQGDANLPELAVWRLGRDEYVVLRSE